MQSPIQRLPSFGRLVVFDAAARHLSFTKAATEQFLTQSAVSRQVATLEAELGVPLFRRGHRRLELTDDGQRMASAVSLSIAGIREAVDAVRSPRRREVLAVTTTPGLASLWLIPRLSDFVASHPGIDVRIDATLDTRALAADGFDLAIRYLQVAHQVGLPLFREAVQPVCAPVLLAPDRPRLRSAADLHAHTLLQLHAPAGSGMPLEWQTWLQAAGASGLEPAAIMTFTQYDAAVAAAVAGHGVVLGRRPLVDELLRSGALVAPFEASTDSARGYSVVVEPAAGRKPAVQALVKWLLDQATRTLDKAI